MAEKEELLSQIRNTLKDPTKTSPVDPLLKEQVENSKADRELKKSYSNVYLYLNRPIVHYEYCLFWCWSRMAEI